MSGAEPLVAVEQEAANLARRDERNAKLPPTTCAGGSIYTG